MMVRAFLSLLVLTLLAAAAQAQRAPTSTPAKAWVKLCDKGTVTAKDKDKQGGEEVLNVCMTLHERIDASSGMLILSAALQNTKRDGKESNHLRVMVPLGMLLPIGMRVSVFPNDVWEKVIKDEKLEEADKAKAKTMKLTFAHCLAVGCVAEVEATPDIIASLKRGGGLVVYATNWSGALTANAVPLAGFAEALEGEPVAMAEYQKQHRWREPLPERGEKCDPFYEPVTKRYSCPGWRR